MYRSEYFERNDLDELSKRIYKSIKDLRRMIPHYLHDNIKRRPSEPYEAFEKIKNGFIYEQDFLLAIAYFFIKKKILKKF